MKNKSTFSAFLIIFAFIAFLLLKEPFIGLADNTDYYRVLQPLGFETQVDNRYFYAYDKYRISGLDAQDVKGSLMKIIDPGIENDKEYFSTQFIFIKVSMAASYLINIAGKKDPGMFDIRVLGILYAAFYSYGFYLFLKNIKIESKIFKALFITISAIILCDIGYIIYFNSFFGEAPIIASLMLAAGSLTALIKSEETGSSIYYSIIFFVSGIMFVGAKVANTPVGILIGLFWPSLLIIKKDKITRTIVILGSVLIVAFSVFYYSSAPKWMNQVNNFQAIFYGILKDSPSPEKDLEELGIPLKYLPLADSHGFINQNDFDIYSEEFQKEVYDKSNFINVLKFYIRNPKRFLDKLVLSAENSLIIRPSYLGNMSEKDQPERLFFTDRFSVWSNLRKNALGYSFYIIVTYSVLFFAVTIYETVMAFKVRDKFKTVSSLSGLLLFFTCMSQFVLPIIGNGEADLQKHMFLFNLCFDMMLLVGAAWTTENYNDKNVLKVVLLTAAASIFLVYIIIPHERLPEESGIIKSGQYIQFGQYGSKPLKWVVLDYSKENGYLIWADTAADVMEFDKADESSSKNIYGSNKWETSDVRNWLNGQFKSGFGKGEASVINKVKLKNMIAFNRTDEKAGGTKPYYWTALTPYVEQNYDTDAYFNYSEEEIFLLDTSQLKKYVYNKSIKVKKMYGTTNERYWLRTPYFSSESMVRVVDRDGYVYHKDADVKAGVVPAMYLKDTIKCAGGDGTEYNPYKIITEENDGGLPDK